MPDYQQGKIYALRSHQTEDVYIGSTTQPLALRFAGHKMMRAKCTSLVMFQYPDVYIELIELCPCNTKEELNKREGEIIRTTNCVNKNIAGRSAKQYWEENRDRILAAKREQYKSDPDLRQRKTKQSLERYYRLKSKTNPEVATLAA
jgi:hypothetical protein